MPAYSRSTRWLKILRPSRQVGAASHGRRSLEAGAGKASRNPHAAWKAAVRLPAAGLNCYIESESAKRGRVHHVAWRQRLPRAADQCEFAGGGAAGVRIVTREGLSSSGAFPEICALSIPFALSVCCLRQPLLVVGDGARHETL